MFLWHLPSRTIGLGFVAPTLFSSVHFSNHLLQSFFAKVRDKGKKQVLPALKELMVCWGNQTCI